MSDHRVRRRAVYYVSGFDPKGPNWYHGTYRRQSKLQSLLSGMTIDVGQRRAGDDHVASWRINAIEDGQRVETDYLFLRWDDIMRDHWPKGTWKMCRLAFSNLYGYLRSGVLWRVYKTAWPTFICAFYPSAFLIGVVFLLLVVATLAVLGLASAISLPTWLLALVGFGLMVLGLHFLVPVLDKRFAIHWLTRIYAFTLVQARCGPPELNERLDLFADQLVRTVREGDHDEVLIVGHSTGGQTAVSLLAKALIRDPELARGSTSVSFLTLGSSIAMLGWQPQAEWFRDEIETVSNAQDLSWVDFSAAQDGACFALRNQASLSLGVDETELTNRPKVLSIKLFDLFSKERFARIRLNFFQVHFQYLMAGEKLAEYDYFAITAGSKTLANRFGNRTTTMNFDRFESKLFRP